MNQHSFLVDFLIGNVLPDVLINKHEGKFKTLQNILIDSISIIFFVYIQ